MIMSRFWPMLAICFCTDSVAPEPIATIAITAATPMITPSIVSVERTLLRSSARSAMPQRHDFHPDAGRQRPTTRITNDPGTIDGRGRGCSAVAAGCRRTPP